MGCDIHCHVEAKIKGQWHYVDELDIDRNYTLFGKMAGVRDKSIEPISKPKGLPEDMSFMTKFKSELWGEDGHSHSWLSAKEVDELEEWIHLDKILPLYKPLGYLFSNGFDGWIKFPNDFERVKKMGLEDFRLVFWFDN